MSAEAKVAALEADAPALLSAGPPSARRRARALGLFVSGVAIATLSAMCGIGGGLFAVPLLHFVSKLALRNAVATSLCLVLALTTTATVAEALRDDSALRWPLVLALIVGALAGAQAGYWISRRIKPRQLRLAFVFVLFVAGFRVLTSEDPAPELAQGVVQFALSVRTVGLSLAIGFSGGFLAPLLGVGGGIVMVPALFLALPEIGYLGARAASLAVSAVTSAHSIVLYARERLIDPSVALPLGAGATLGGVLGVVLVHQPGGAEYAQVAMGTILLFVALRFLVEALRARDIEVGAKR